jgi:tight adherence protein B
MIFSPVLVLWFGGAVAFVLLIVGIVVTVTSDRSIEQQRLQQITGGRVIEEREKVRTTPLTDWINSRVQGSSIGDKIARNLARADLKMKPGEYIAMVVLMVTAGGLVLWVIGRGSPYMIPVGMLAGGLAPGIYVGSQQKRRLIKFDQQLPDMLNLMVNGLRAGYSTMQAMEAVSKELPPPICDEYRRVVQEMQLGIPMERALDNLLRRIPSDDLDLVITAINVQREVGGNLAEILDTISYTIRERVRIKGEIRVLTTQVMYSGRFLALMPVFVILILYFLNPEYMMEFFKPEAFPCGYIALGLAALLIVGGYFAMNKLGEVEV